MIVAMQKLEAGAALHDMYVTVHFPGLRPRSTNKRLFHIGIMKLGVTERLR